VPSSRMSGRHGVAASSFIRRYFDRSLCGETARKRAGFAELRNAFLRFGGSNTAQFLQLDKEIEDFAGQSIAALPTPARTLTGSPMQFVGVNAGLAEQLDRIELQAIALRDEAAGGMKLCRDELAKELVPLEC
jgi:hypothetical protein